jgi:hypothetical protein
MQRRKVEPSSSLSAATPGGGPEQQDPRAVIALRGRPRVKRGGSDSLTILIVVVLLLAGILTILSPSTVEKAEQKAANSAIEIMKEAYVAEQHVEEFFTHQQQQQLPPLQTQEDGAGKQRSSDATEAMKRQPSTWVDSEKKLKNKLKELVAIQQTGKDLGVPILTRWLGDDFPAWVSEGEDKDAWEKKRKERYDAMAKEEEEWRASARKYLEKIDYDENE